MQRHGPREQGLRGFRRFRRDRFGGRHNPILRFSLGSAPAAITLLHGTGKAGDNFRETKRISGMEEYARLFLTSSII
jgi:hypothetical protein